MKSTRTIFTILLISIFGCSKDSKINCDPFTTITNGKWQYTELFAIEEFIAETGEIFNGDVLEQLDSCSKTIVFVLNSNFLINLENSNFDCSSFDDYGDWSLDGLKFTIHEEDENEFFLHHIECLDSMEISGILELEDSNLAPDRLRGRMRYTLTKI